MKPNYSFAKRQRDLAKKQKKEEKLQKKAESKGLRPTDGEQNPEQPSADTVKPE